MSKKSAGLLPFRKKNNVFEFFLVHPGGPFWTKKDINAWSIAKGEYEETEDPLSAAKREFGEETGVHIEGEFISLAPVKQSGGKVVSAWAVEADFDSARIKSNEFEIEWPPKSGKMATFPEVDRAGWFSLEIAKEKILKGQLPFLDELAKALVAV